jgi:hypothetical protein
VLNFDNQKMSSDSEMIASEFVKNKEEKEATMMLYDDLRNLQAKAADDAGGANGNSNQANMVNELNLMLSSLPGTSASTSSTTTSSMSSASSLASLVPPVHESPTAATKQTDSEHLMHELELLEHVCTESLATFDKLASVDSNGFALRFTLFFFACAFNPSSSNKRKF